MRRRRPTTRHSNVQNIDRTRRQWPMQFRSLRGGGQAWHRHKAEGLEQAGRSSTRVDRCRARVLGPTPPPERPLLTVVRHAEILRGGRDTGPQRTGLFEIKPGERGWPSNALESRRLSPTFPSGLRNSGSKVPSIPLNLSPTQRSLRKIDVCALFCIIRDACGKKLPYFEYVTISPKSFQILFANSPIAMSPPTRTNTPVHN